MRNELDIHKICGWDHFSKAFNCIIGVRHYVILRFLNVQKASGEVISMGDL
jgi:hypothetical protein